MGVMMLCRESMRIADELGAGWHPAPMVMENGRVMPRAACGSVSVSWFNMSGGAGFIARSRKRAGVGTGDTASAALADFVARGPAVA